MSRPLGRGAVSPAVTPVGRAVRGVVAALVLGGALLLGGCIVVPAGPGWRPYHYGYGWR